MKIHSVPYVLVIKNNLEFHHVTIDFNVRGEIFIEVSSTIKFSFKTNKQIDLKK